jgi:hypothetical protein
MLTIQLGEFVKESENIFIILIFTLQVAIAILTIWKLHGDIRNNKRKKLNAPQREHKGKPDI